MTQQGPLSINSDPCNDHHHIFAVSIPIDPRQLTYKRPIRYHAMQKDNARSPSIYDSPTMSIAFLLLDEYAKYLHMPPINAR